MRGRHLVAVLCALLAVVLTVSACGSSSDDSSSSTSTGASTGGAASGNKDPITIGATFGLTGPMSFYDQPMVQGIEAAIKDVNARGGIDGRPVRLITNDNQSDVNKLVQSARDMIAKRPTLLLTSSSNTTGGPAARVANAAGQLTMGAAGNTIYGKTGGGELVFNDWHGDPTEAAALAQFADRKGYDSVYIAEDLALDYTQDVCRYFRTAYRGRIVGEVRYNSSTDQSFNSQVTQIRSAAPEARAIVICGLTTGGPTLIKQLRSAGVDNPVIGTGGGMDGDFWARAVPNLGEFYSDSVASVYGDDPDPARNELVARITRETGRVPPTGHIFIAYSVVEMLKKAIEDSGGKTDAATLQKAYESFRDVPTIAGTTTYTADCHVPIGRTLAITEIVDGRGRFVEAIKPADVPRAIC
ncbi:ABC transporter substrate-binding protein [Conexibacter sp. CPCC 206217]|uniref:ABC transporter substrate-binding protein n=1 Tax=Conexibacter sp. CPCC 206217 TaxID=3064574 RepID=UPI00271EBBC7|nr:ABC transporter substrate-binding protein [Conexibacter sp. CPCC 206217]MDO8210096.1 ABC transporter substrate-binding protein [Conexibacter sp. CPCC 206217]